MTTDEMLELIGILAGELIDAAALNHYYASLLSAKPRPWRELSEMQRDAFNEAALKQAQKILDRRGWGLDFQLLKEMARS